MFSLLSLFCFPSRNPGQTQNLPRLPLSDLDRPLCQPCPLLLSRDCLSTSGFLRLGSASHLPTATPLREELEQMVAFRTAVLDLAVLLSQYLISFEMYREHPSKDFREILI